MEFLKIPHKLHMLCNSEWQGRSAFVICSDVHTGVNTEGRGRQKRTIRSAVAGWGSHDGLCECEMCFIGLHFLHITINIIK
jgi:hypothetical protein